METRHERLRQAYDYIRANKGIHTQKELAARLGYTREYLSGALNGNKSNLTDELIDNLCQQYPDTFNPDYLKSGKGELLTVTEEIFSKDHASRPQIPVTAAAGHISEYIGGIYRHQCQELPVVRTMPDYDFTMIIKGDSMEPKYEGGDEIACKRIEKTIEWGKAYIIDTDDGAFFKRIFDDGKSITCRSYNPEYPDFHVDKADINAIYKVIGLIRINP